MRLGFEHGFVFGGSLSLLVYGLASGVCLDVRESIADAGMHDDSGIVLFSGNLTGKRKYCKLSRKEQEARGGKVFVFL